MTHKSDTVLFLVLVCVVVGLVGSTIRASLFGQDITIPPCHCQCEQPPLVHLPVPTDPALVAGESASGDVMTSSTATGDVATGDISANTSTTGSATADTPKTTTPDALGGRDDLSVTYPMQPQRPAGSYQTNSAQLANRARNHQDTVTIPDGYTPTQMVVVTRKPVDPARSMIIYVAAGGRRCGGAVTAHERYRDDTTYTLDLTAMDINANGDHLVCDGDRSRRLVGEVTIAGYVGDYNGHGIESITLK